MLRLWAESVPWSPFLHWPGANGQQANPVWHLVCKDTLSVLDSRRRLGVGEPDDESHAFGVCGQRNEWETLIFACEMQPSGDCSVLLWRHALVPCGRVMSMQDVLLFGFSATGGATEVTRQGGLVQRGCDVMLRIALLQSRVVVLVCCLFVFCLCMVAMNGVRFTDTWKGGNGEYGTHTRTRTHTQQQQQQERHRQQMSLYF